MKPLLLSAVLLFSSLTTGLLLTSCASNEGGAAGDGTYSAPAPLSPVDATEAMRSEFRNIR